MAKFIVAAHRNQDVGEWTGIRFATECNGVFNAVQCETIGLLCFKLDANHAGYLDKAFPFGKRVSVAFPECSEDIFEAHQCMAFERYTAAMFHIGRAMETTVRKVAKKMGTKSKDRDCVAAKSDGS